jgi:hypothetical protein
MIINDYYQKLLSDKLKETFGKDTFTEDELTKEFYEELLIRCGRFFQTADGAVNMNAFWSEGFREWLLKEK